MLASRRLRLPSRASASALGLLVLAGSGQAQSSAKASTAIRSFSIHVPRPQLTDLRKRIAEARWPGKEMVADRSQGAPLTELQALVRYWGSGYDWRKAEAKLNALPQFLTKIDGIDIHFIW